MAFRDRLPAMLAAVWAEHGEPATWNGAPCTVCREQPDEEIRFGTSRALVGTVMLEVRRSDVPVALDGDTVVINPDTAPETFTIIADPVGDELQVLWLCQAKPA